MPRGEADASPGLFDVHPLEILRGDVGPHVVYAPRHERQKTVMTKQLFIALGLVTVAASSVACAEHATVRVREPVVTETVAVPATPVITEKVVVAQPVVATPVVTERVVVAPVVPVVTEKVVVKKPVIKETVVVH
jgi:hypothetical protein